MSVSSEFIEWNRERYLRSGKAKKGEILSDFCEVTGYHRKHATRLLGRRRAGRPANAKRRGPKSRYENPEFKTALRRLWLVSDQMCSKLLKAAIPQWLPSYEKHYGALSPEIKTKLLAISAPTIDRVLKPVRVKYGKSPGGTKPGSLLREEIAIQGTSWDNGVPGFVEADTVAHCGNSLNGEFIWSLTLTDINTHWTECRAVWHKGSKGVVEMIHDIELHLPFSLKGFDCDNGSEFLNNYLKAYFAQEKYRKINFAFTRSRPYRKNDNAHVEQRNWSHARQLFGRARLEFLPLLALMNDIYRNEFSLYKNHFCPTLKLDSKVLIQSRYRRRYEAPKTPYQRVMDSEHVNHETNAALEALHQQLDPIALRRSLNAKLKAFYKQLNLSRLKQSQLNAA